MALWMHLNINFKEVTKIMEKMAQEASLEKPQGSYVELMRYLKKAVDSISPKYIRRFFFLFEPDPHLFLALEAKDAISAAVIKRKITRIKRPDFIQTAEIKINTGDGGHPQPVIDFFHVGSKYAIFRATGDYQPGYKNHDEAKLVHCFCNQLFVEVENEIGFYRKCLKVWEGNG